MFGTIRAASAARRARRIYEAERLASLLATITAENERRRVADNAPCRFCIEDDKAVQP